ARKVLNRLMRLVGAVVIFGSLTALVWAQAAPAGQAAPANQAAQPQWKDQGESDIGLAANNEKDPAKKLELLKKWEQQYPDSALKNQRVLMVAQVQLAILNAAYQKTDPAVLASGQKAG